MFQMDNLAVVRFKKGGQRFELACYKDKVLSWRNRLITNLNEVLQSDAVFTNVSKGQQAKIEELVKAFGIEDRSKISIEILEKGELQLSDKERQVNRDALFKAITNLVADTCLNPKTKRPHSVAAIEQSMRDIHFTVDPAKSVKNQSLEAINLLQGSGKLPIERSLMKCRLAIPVRSEKEGKMIAEKLRRITQSIESEEYWNKETLEIVCTVQPGHFCEVENVINRETKGNASIEVQSFRVSED